MMRNYQQLLAYSVAIGSAAIALLLSLWLEPLISRTIGAFFYIAIIVSTWYGGFRPGIVTLVLSTVAIDYLLMHPRSQIWLGQPEKLLRLSIFLLVALVINLITSNLQYSRRKIQQLNQQLSQENAEQLRMALNERKQAQETLQQQFEQQRLVMEMTQRIRRSLNLQDILQTTVDEVRQFLECDRVTIFQFYPGWGGTIIVESVAPEWMALLPLQIHDPCIGEENVEPFKQGLVTAKTDIYTAGISPCHVAFLESLQVRANLVVPVSLGDELWGLLAAHQCKAPREWQSSEIALLRQLGAQVGIAIQQADLFKQLQTELTERKQAEIDLQQLNTELEQRVQERTAQLTETNDRLRKTVIEQQQTQLTLLEQAQMLELQAVITRNMGEGICLVRIDNAIIVYANPKFEQMFGYDSGELNGQHVSIINYVTRSVTNENVNQATLSTVLQNTEATYEAQNLKKDGTPFWCSVTASVFRHPDYGDVLVAVHQDITERKGIEEALRESQEKFRQMAENIQAIFWIKDIRNQQVLYVSNAYETIWQNSCENLYHNHSNWLDAIHPEDRQRVEIEFIEKFRTGHYDNKYRIIRPDGSIRWIRDRAFPIKNELGELVRIAGIAEDITELEQINLIKSEFIGIVSHELRTPLTAIRAALGLLQTGIYDKKPDKFKRMIEIAAIDSDRLVRLVNDILDLERLESDRAVLEKTTCNAADLIQQAVAVVQAIANQQNITFQIHPTNAQVWAAADAIVQTLTNLLGNAIKFSPADSTITLSVQQQTDRVLFQITDQGRGIPADKLEAIFGRFQQVDASDSRTKGGTGLGLAICRSIIDRHGGQIWAESTLGAGSTFFFTLPLPGN
ncbi:MAG: ATP-binding protein [Nostoc sp. EfeVER01]|uniref:ATP-binding protein n=1 Tax=unclassified Nostoc TaxID=2593658 RepID=UPI002AD2CD81|nr:MULTISPECIES: ATP-binding protein [unclassified Nostoc]MDZ7949396.1 PAS domain-containing protein [Nostoc sp. EfeVER01]MDZ7993812.1 PAS domain-containing protein [Nostoc sp. EspVER01]